MKKGSIIIFLVICTFFGLCRGGIMSNQFVRAKNHGIDGYTKAEEGEWREPYIFIFATDPQPGLVDLVAGGDGSRWDVEIDRTEKAVAAINKMQPRPKFLIIGGDIIDAFPGTEHRPQQIADLRQAFSTLSPSIPILIVSGNHDLGNIPTDETMEGYRREFGDEYYSFWVGGVFYIVINTQCIFNPAETESLCDVQDTWLESQLEIARSSSCAHVVIFMHIPLFIDNPEEGNTYFSIPRQKRLAMLQQFAQVGIKKVFSGHYHRSAGGTWTNDDGSATIEVIVSSALGAQLGTDQAGIRVVKVKQDEILHEYHALADIPTSVPMS